jgi:hypothetical protein
MGPVYLKWDHVPQYFEIFIRRVGGRFVYSITDAWGPGGGVQRFTAPTAPLPIWHVPTGQAAQWVSVPVGQWVSVPVGQHLGQWVSDAPNLANRDNVTPRRRGGDL